MKTFDITDKETTIPVYVIGFDPEIRRDTYSVSKWEDELEYDQWGRGSDSIGWSSSDCCCIFQDEDMEDKSIAFVNTGDYTNIITTDEDVCNEIYNKLVEKVNNIPNLAEETLSEMNYK